MTATYNYIVSDSDQTIDSFLSQFTLSPDLTVQQFLAFEGNTSVSNYTKILGGNTIEQLQSNQQLFSSGDYGNIIINQGVVIIIDNSQILREVIRPVEPEQFVTTEFKPFIAKELDKLIRNPRYVSNIISQTGDPNTGGEIVINEFTVLMWIRTMSSTYKSTNHYQSQSVGTWVNVSSFVESITINSTGQGSSFVLSMMPISCINSSIGWSLESISNAGNDDIVSESIFKADKDGYKRNDFFFHTAVQKNDLVMIKLEKLNMEGKRPIDFNLKSSDITGEDKVYDLIGLVDTCSQSSVPNNININVSGRDLTKIFIEENSVFFPEQFAGDIFANTGILSQRLLLERDLQTVAFATYDKKTIDTILRFVFNKYSTIGYIPDEVFNIYGQRAIKDKYQLQGSSVAVSQASQLLLQQKRTGIWQIMELVIDSEVARRVLVDNNIVHDQGSIINGLNKICQMPLVQFYTDTYGDKFYLIVRKPPFDKQGYTGMVYDTITTKSSVEVTSDTNTQPSTQTTTINPSSNNSLVIDVDDNNVLGDSLVYHDEIYTWFRMVPQGLIANLPTLAHFIYVPIIPLDLYAEVWGSRPLSIEYNYCPAEYVIDKNTDKTLSYVELQTFKDLQFVVQSYQYMPFVRRGTITIDGDRRIKKGMFIRYKPTGEIFYVEGITHNRSIRGNKNDRSTILTVSRGMVEKYIKGIDIDFNGVTKRVSYFDIVPTDIPSNASVNNRAFLRDWKADPDIFNFFLQRQQWG